MPSMLSRKRCVLAVAAMLCGAFGVSPCAAHDDHAKRDQTKRAAAQNVRVSLPDTPLTDQDGRRTRFRNDALGDRIVIIDFVFTTCTTVCPVVSAVLADAQKKLGERVGSDVALVTVTVDPVRDTAARLKEYGTRLGAGPGWTWLTGAPPQVQEVLKAFGAYTLNFNDHPPLVFVGDARSGQWMRFYGFPSADQLLKAVDALTAARKAARGG
jgi:protein SCO1/2